MTPRFLSLATCFLLTLVAGGGCGWLVPDAPPDPPSSSPQPTGTPELTYEDITLTEVEPDGTLLWRLTARLARYNQEETAASLDSVTGEVFDQANSSIKVKANSGSAFPNENRLALTGEVQVQSPSHQVQITADQVAWWPDDNRLQAEGNVVLIQIPAAIPESSSPQPGEPATLTLVPPESALWIAKAEALEVDLMQNQVTLQNPDSQSPVQARAREPELDLEASRISWNLNTGEITASGPIQVAYPEQQVQMQGERLITTIPSDQIRLQGNTYSRSEATGQELWAEQLQWTPHTPLVNASGNVRYRQPGQNLAVTGETAIVNWEAQTVAISGGTTTEVALP
ncbi:MAG: LPS export ABC transporter periplasmic protein LptC [Synechococcaceae cyanobacterium SM2_3_1]|nr:LPS export ABC transporter periplasmic protein LptC [Synechococcaceae cyanobacterium SM2_3_1]